MAEIIASLIEVETLRTAGDSRCHAESNKKRQVNRNFNEEIYSLRPTAQLNLRDIPSIIN